MILVVIPAKAGSSRLPGKNMRHVNGRPMIDYAIEDARRSRKAHQIVVTTDSDEIDRHVRSLGVAVVRRPVSLGGDVPLFDVYKHAAEQIGLDKVDYLVGLQVDHPDRRVSVDDAFAFFLSKGADYLTSSDASGKVNGSYKIYSHDMLITGEAKNHVVLVDDCTNIHYEDELKQAEINLMARVTRG